MVRHFSSVEEFAACAGEEIGVSDWLTVTQSRIDAFADATGDHQWVHVDVERAKSGPYAKTIAHGYLTLSLIPLLSTQIYEIGGVRLGLNYGLDRVRFPAPLPVDSNIRATATLTEAASIDAGTRLTITFVVEADSQTKPVCVASWIYVLAG